METAETLIKTYWLTAATGIFGWLVGFFTDIGKEHWKLKLQRRGEHAAQIQNEILTPIYEYLNSFYLPVCQRKIGPLEVGSETVQREPKNITERSEDHARYQIVAKHPFQVNPSGAPGYEYWRQTESFRRYFEDAKKNHYRELLARWEAFIHRFDEMRAGCAKLAEALSVELQKEIALPPRIAWGLAMETPTWANYEALAVLILNRQLGMNSIGVHVYQAEIKAWGTQEQLIKCPSEADAPKFVALVDKPTQVDRAARLRSACESLEKELDVLITDFRFALAKKPPLKGCPYV